MNKLRELQHHFHNAVLNRQTDVSSILVTKNKISGERRIGIYENTIFTNLRETLRTTYPVTNQLVGEDFFDYLADSYTYNYASPAGDLNQFGEYFSQHIHDTPEADCLPYLADTAALEWLAHKTYHAADIPPLDINKLQNVHAERTTDLVLRLSPARALFESRYPVHKIWRVNQPGYAGNDKVDLDEGGIKLLISRRAHHIELQTLTSGLWMLLKEIACKCSLSEAITHASRVEPELNLANMLALLINDGTLVEAQLGSVNTHPI